MKWFVWLITSIAVKDFVFETFCDKYSTRLQAVELIDRWFDRTHHDIPCLYVRSIVKKKSSTVFETTKQKHNSFEKIKDLCYYLRKNINWLRLSTDYLRQVQVHKFAQNFFEMMENKREKKFTCKALFYDHMYTFNELDNFSSL